MAIIGLLHPGEMGASLGAALRANQHTVLFAAEGRSPASRQRAARAGIQAAERLTDLTGSAEIVFSVCPPDAAVAVAEAVADTGFSGLYVDANAIAPATATALAAIVGRAGADFVDGDIIGGPIGPGSGTRLYLSGPRAGEVAALNGKGTDPECVVLGDDPTAASTLKMCYAAWTKGSSALLLAIAAVAGRAGLSQALEDEWARSQPDVGSRLARALQTTPAKAWRFVSEMEEIGHTFTASGLSDGFGVAAADTYRRLEGFKNRSAVEPAEVVAALLRAP